MTSKNKSFLRAGCSVLAFQIAVLAISPSLAFYGESKREAGTFQEAPTPRLGGFEKIRSAGFSEGQAMALGKHLGLFGITDDPVHISDVRTAIDLVRAGAPIEKITPESLGWTQAHPDDISAAAAVTKAGLDFTSDRAETARQIIAHTSIKAPTIEHFKAAALLAAKKIPFTEDNLHAVVSLRGRLQVDDKDIDKGAIEVVIAARKQGPIIFKNGDEVKDYQKISEIIERPLTPEEFRAFQTAKLNGVTILNEPELLAATRLSLFHMPIQQDPMHAVVALINKGLRNADGQVITFLNIAIKDIQAFERALARLAPGIPVTQEKFDEARKRVE